MSDAVDTIRLEAELVLENANREYEAARKRWEQPIQLTFTGGNAAAPGATATGRTFGGGSVVTGPLNYTPVSSPSVINRGPGLQDLALQSFTARTSIGGSGFGPAVTHLPTSSTNSVYGDTHTGVSAPIVSSTNIGGYRSYARRALAAGIMSPHSPAQYATDQGMIDAEAEYYAWAGQRDANARGRAGVAGPVSSGYRLPSIDLAAINRLPTGRSRLQQVADSLPALAGTDPRFQTSSRYLPNFRGRIGSALGVYGALELAGGAFGASAGLDMAIAQAGGDPYALAQARIANDPMRSMVESIPLIGGVASAAGEFFTGGRTAAARSIMQAQLADQIGTYRLNQAIGLRSASVGVAASAASLASPGASQLVSLSGQMGMVELQRSADFRQSSIPLTNAIRAAAEAEDAPRAALERYRGRARRADETSNFSEILYHGNFYGLSAVDTAKAEGPLRQAEAATQAARDKLEAAEGDSKRLAQLQLDAMTNQIRGIGQQASDAAAMTRSSSMLGAAATRLSRRGYGLEGGLTAVDAEYSGQIAQASRNIARLGGVDTGGMTPDARAAHHELQRQAEGAYDALVLGRTLAREGVGLDYGRGMIAGWGGVAAGRMRLAGDPYGAMQTELSAGFASDTIGMNPMSPGFALRAAQYGVAAAQTAQARRYEGIDIGTSLGFEGIGQQYRYNRNPIGAQAAGLAASGLQRARDLQRAGYDAFAQQARAQTSTELDLLARDYGFSFRAQQADLQNVSIFNPRDAQDPSEVFGSIRAEQGRLNDADLNAGKDGGGKGITRDEVRTAVEDAIRATFPDLLAR